MCMKGIHNIASPDKHKLKRILISYLKLIDYISKLLSTISCKHYNIYDVSKFFLFINHQHSHYIYDQIYYLRKSSPLSPCMGHNMYIRLFLISLVLSNLNGSLPSGWNLLPTWQAQEKSKHVRPLEGDVCQNY